jgi:hypothetical protein
MKAQVLSSRAGLPGRSRLACLVTVAWLTGAMSLAGCGQAEVAGLPSGSSGGGQSGGPGLGGAGGPGLSLDAPGLPVGDGGVDLGTNPTQDPPPADCGPGGSCAAGFICTIGNKCGKAGGMCTGAADCQGDTYCCDSTCRQDGQTAGVCIPGNVPPGAAAACKGAVKVGVFSPQIQCEWTDENESYVASSPVVGDLPNDPGSGEIVFVSFGDNADRANTGMTTGSLRIIRGNDCKLLETISDTPIRANTTPALADLDGDGTIEIVALKSDGKPIAFKWNGTKYAPYWSASSGPNAIGSQLWSAVSIHNLDDDDTPEVLVGGPTADAVHTYNGHTGQEVGPGVQLGTSFNGMIPIVADVDGDMKPELITNWQSGVWMSKWLGPGLGWDPLSSVKMGQQVSNYTVSSHFAVADFGTPMPGGGFDSTVLDGIAEIVTSEAEIGGKVTIMTLTGQVLMSVDTMKDMGSDAVSEGGGPPVIADFDNDGRPEVGIAGGSRFRVFDLKCKAAGGGCEGNYVRWSRPSQDASSRQTGASVFDFDGDGQAEVVYADECFLRVYNGKTGEVLFSTPRTSGTWYENPVVADVDRDDHVEIVVNSAYSVACPSGGTAGTPYVDPIHPGVRCGTDDDCVLGTKCQMGFCRCAGDNQCDKGLSCAPPLAGTAGTGNVCRSTHPNLDPKVTKVKGGVKVVNDRLDRWASSLPIWNQHAFSINNVRANGSIPKMSEWARNWTEKKKGYNSFRQNAQGTAGADDLADVTGKLDVSSICRIRGNKVVLTARVCNRGRRAVGSQLPATFYDKDGKILCVSYTTLPVQGNNDCQPVTCEADPAQTVGTIKIVVNDDGKGGRTTIECREENNSDQLEIKPDACRID